MGANLSAEVIGDLLVISIGAKALAFAVNSSDYAQPVESDSGECVLAWEVSDPVGFLEDVARELDKMGEDGSTPITRMLDRAARAVIQGGSEHISQVEQEL